MLQLIGNNLITIVSKLHTMHRHLKPLPCKMTDWTLSTPSTHYHAATICKGIQSSSWNSLQSRETAALSLSQWRPFKKACGLDVAYETKSMQP